MKIFLKDLVNIADEKKYDIQIDYYEVKDNIFLKGLKEIKGDITFYYDINDQLRANYVLEGFMICPDAYSLEDVDVPINLQEDLEVVKDMDADGLFLDQDIDIIELALVIILPEVPIKVVKNKKIEYPRGDGWAFVSEEEITSSKGQSIDSRLQKLKEFKFEEDD